LARNPYRRKQVGEPAAQTLQQLLNEHEEHGKEDQRGGWKNVIRDVRRFSLPRQQRVKRDHERQECHRAADYV
jgi:hypothetical protein